MVIAKSQGQARVPRVVLVTHVGALSGAEIALRRLVNAIDRQRFEPVVLTFASGPLVDVLRADGIEVVVEPLSAGSASVRRSAVLAPTSAARAIDVARFAIRLARTMRRLDADLVHAASLKADVLCAVVRRRVGLPLIWHIHDRISEDYLPSRTAALMRGLVRRIPDHVIVNSNATAATLLPLPRGWTLAYPGLDMARVPIRDPSGRSGPPVVGLLGRIGPTKGQEQFLRAACDVLRTHPETKFRVIGSAMFGEESYRSDLLRLVDHLGIRSSVDFTGFVDSPLTALQDLDVFVHASPLPEPFGQAIVEAMAVGVPAVVTDGGGASEIIREGGELLAIPARPGRSDDLASGIRQVIDRRPECMALAVAARESVRRRFDIQITADQVVDAWRDVLDDHVSQVR